MPYVVGKRIDKAFLNDKIAKILHLADYVYQSDAQGLELLTGDLIHYTDLRATFKKIDDAIKTMWWNSDNALFKWVKVATWEDSSLLGVSDSTLFLINYDDTAYYSQTELETLLTVDGYNIVNEFSTNYDKYSKILYWNSIDTLLNTVFKYIFVKRSSMGAGHPLLTDARSPYHEVAGGYVHIEFNYNPPPNLDDGIYYTTGSSPTNGSNPSTVNSNLNSFLTTNIFTLTNDKNTTPYYTRFYFGLTDYKAWAFNLFSTPNYYNYYRSISGSGINSSIQKNIAYFDAPLEVELRAVVRVQQNYRYDRFAENGVTITETYLTYHSDFPYSRPITSNAPVPLLTVPTSTTLVAVGPLVQTSIASLYTALTELNQTRIPTASNPTGTPNTPIGNTDETGGHLEVYPAGIMVKIPDYPV
jgi:hypothetical protein